MFKQITEILKETLYTLFLCRKPEEKYTRKKRNFTEMTAAGKKEIFEYKPTKKFKTAGDILGELSMDVGEVIDSSVFKLKRNKETKVDCPLLPSNTNRSINPSGNVNYVNNVNLQVNDIPDNDIIDFVGPEGKKYSSKIYHDNIIFTVKPKIFDEDVATPEKAALLIRDHVIFPVLKEAMDEIRKSNRKNDTCLLI